MEMVFLDEREGGRWCCCGDSRLVCGIKGLDGFAGYTLQDGFDIAKDTFCIPE